MAHRVVIVGCQRLTEMSTQQQSQGRHTGRNLDKAMRTKAVGIAARANEITRPDLSVVSFPRDRVYILVVKSAWT